MNKLPYIGTIAKVRLELLFLLCILLPLKGTGETPVRKVFLVHTSDTHSCIEPISPNFGDPAQANKGGYLRRVALLEQIRQEHPDDMLLLDCGDFSQGSVYYNLYRGEVEVKLAQTVSGFLAKQLES